MALREVLAELDVKVNGLLEVERANLSVDQFVNRSAAGRRGARMFATGFDQIARNAGRATPAVKQSAASMLGLGLSTSEATAGMGPLSLSLGPVGVALAAATAGAAALVGTLGALASAVSEIVSEVVELGDELGDTSARLGLSADQLSQWRFIAERAGVDAGELDGAFRNFNRTVGQAARGNNAQSQSFRRLGIAIRGANGELRPTGDVLDDAIVRLRAIENPTRRAADAQRLFGRSGAAVAQLTEMSSEEVGELTARWRELTGGGLGDFVQQAGEADDAMKEWDLSITALKVVLVNNLLKPLTEIVTTLATFTGQVTEFIRNSSILEATLGVLAAGFVALGAVIAVVLAPVAILLAPFVAILVAIGVAVLAVILTVEDLVTAFRGGDSMIGRFVESMLRARGITMDFIGVVETFGLAWDRAVVSVQEAIASILRTLSGVQRTLGVEVIAGLSGAASRATRTAQSGRASVNARQQEINIAARQRIRERNATSASLPPAPVVQTRAGRASRRARGGQIQQTNSATYNINGAQDPRAVAREVDRINQRQARRALEELPQLAPGAT